MSAASRKKKEALEFCRKTGRQPSPSIETEVRIYKMTKRYSSPLTEAYDPEFAAEINKFPKLRRSSGISNKPVKNLTTGDIYLSIQAAAAATSTSPGQITKSCQGILGAVGKHDYKWAWADITDNPSPRPDVTRKPSPFEEMSMVEEEMRTLRKELAKAKRILDSMQPRVTEMQGKRLDRMSWIVFYAYGGYKNKEEAFARRQELFLSPLLKSIGVKSVYSIPQKRFQEAVDYASRLLDVVYKDTGYSYKSGTVLPRSQVTNLVKSETGSYEPGWTQKYLQKKNKQERRARDE